ncbi:ribose-5-phosphate isomerase RpiA [Candidatus Halobonum tyrrellensis]|uniref:Ribose-5-phosphate isomerase A n=1 Tax=Candidatus Halobonum tyrrellensis G22 TaxID=1324957 RepID=V4GS15_9EURY|nr:ribose-5-phosphate isomerase RpiA [Candidatus Halobonum tyrrellensis]ESP87846.1 ribose-5-phosphate isomerase A [Candidatus Halobonum tyrrellensis G22]
MKSNAGGDDAKRAAGERAAEFVADGDVVGLGTGSTAAHAIRRLGERVDEGLAVEGVATSHGARELAREAGVPLRSLGDTARVDVAVDGADQAAGGDLIKGGGAAHAREKIVDAMADRFVVVVDDTKLADALSRPVPVEVLPAARASVAAAVRDAGGEPTLRAAARKDGPVVTDNGNLVVDCDFGRIADPAALARTLAATPGAVEHGLFVGLADDVVVGTPDGAAAVESEK